MASYDFRCKNCGTEFTLSYKSIKAYDEAVRTCPKCGSVELSRVIKRVALQSPSRDFTRMSSDEMLSVLDSGDSRQVGQMFEQVGGTSPEMGVEYQDATQRLLRGESMDKVEKALQETDAAKPKAAPPPPPSSGDM